jgi:hypothetical protein
MSKYFFKNIPFSSEEGQQSIRQLTGVYGNRCGFVRYASEFVDKAINYSIYKQIMYITDN